MSRPIVDVAGYLPTDLATRMDLWPAGPQRSGAHVTSYGLGAFSSHSEYPTRTELTVCDSEHRVHLSVWLRDGVDVDTDGWKFRVDGRDTVAGFLPGAPWRTDFGGHAHHVGLLLRPEVLHSLGGDPAADFFERLRRDGFLQVTPARADILRAAQELDDVLLSGPCIPLLREAKSLELLARLIMRDGHEGREQVPPGQRERLFRARELLLADLARAPTIEALARASGLNTFSLKRGFRRLFGVSIHAFHQQERMRAAWHLIEAGKLSVADAGDAVGYTNMSHFGVAFRKAFGILPSELKRRPLSSLVSSLERTSE